MGVIAANAPHSATPKTPNLDPEPYVSGLGNRHVSNLNPAIWVFDPRPEYSQNIEDYE